MSLAFSHIAISCKEPLAIERYYTRYFGFRRARVIPLGQDQIVFIKSGSMYLELFRAEGEPPAHEAPDFMAKYGGLMARDPEEWGRLFSVALRVRPSAARGHAPEL